MTVNQIMNQILREPSQEMAKAVKLTRLMEVMKSLADEKFTGYIKVNFSQGGIGRIEKFEEILRYK